jgi:hypothetical protein
LAQGAFSYLEGIEIQFLGSELDDNFASVS